MLLKNDKGLMENLFLKIANLAYFVTKIRFFCKFVPWKQGVLRIIESIGMKE